MVEKRDGPTMGLSNLKKKADEKDVRAVASYPMGQGLNPHSKHNPY